MTPVAVPDRTPSTSTADPALADGGVVSARETRLGVAFCGGASRRMGTDKAQLVDRRSGKTLLEGAVAVLDGVAGEVVLASGAEPRYPELGRDCILDRVPGAGPLGGLLAALECAESRGFERALALACDMPRVSAELLEELFSTAERDDLDACLLVGEAGVEPLCAVYHKRCAPHVRRALAAGKRRMISFHGPELRIGTLEPGAEERFDANVNTMDDFERELGEAARDERGGDA